MASYRNRVLATCCKHPPLHAKVLCLRNKSNARDALVAVLGQVAVGVVQVLLPLVRAALLEVARQRGRRAVVIQRARQLVGAHLVVHRLQAVSGIGVAQLVHRPKLLGPGVGGISQQAPAAQAQDVAVVVVADEAQAVAVLLRVPGPGRGRRGGGQRPGHVVALQQPVQRVVHVAVRPLHPVAPAPPGLPRQVAVVLLVAVAKCAGSSSSAQVFLNTNYDGGQIFFSSPSTSFLNVSKIASSWNRLPKATNLLFSVL